MKIYKLSTRRINEVPPIVKFLDCQIQDDIIMVWAIVDDSRPIEPVEFEIYGTGDNVNLPLENYIGTVQKSGYVWHIFKMNS